MSTAQPSLVTQMIVVERYGMRVSTDQLAELLHMKRQSVLNKISDGTLSIPTYVDGGRRFADYRDVARYIDDCRQAATA